MFTATTQIQQTVRIDEKDAAIMFADASAEEQAALFIVFYIQVVKWLIVVIGISPTDAGTLRR